VSIDTSQGTIQININAMLRVRYIWMVLQALNRVLVKVEGIKGKLFN